MTRYPLKPSRVWQRIAGFILLVGCIWGLITATPGRADIRLESRVNGLEYQLRLVQAELNRLSSTARSQPVQPASPTPSAPPASGAYFSLDQQFDNLATLAIELKDDLRALEARVAALEQIN